MTLHRLPLAKWIRCAGLSVLVALGPAAGAQDALTLYHRFTLPAPGEWAAVTVELVPDRWRVGRPDGPPATERELRGVLNALEWLTIGGHCTAAVDGDTAYPCAYAVRGLDLAGVVDPQFRVRADTEAPVMWSMFDIRGLDAGGGPIAANAQSVRRPQAAVGRIEQFAAIVAPPSYLGDQGAGYGKRLRFAIRAVPNAIAESSFDAASGLVILRRSAARVERSPQSISRSPQQPADAAGG